MTASTIQAAPSRRAAVYRLYDAEGTLLYIGSAYDPDERCKGHQGKPWWVKVARRTEEWFGHRNAAYREELKAIRAESPRYNQMGTPSYRTPNTEAVRRRNKLASLRGHLLGESGSVSVDVHLAAREAGYTREQAHRMGKLAQIEFLDRTGLFPAAVKRYRAALETTAAQE